MPETDLALIQTEDMLDELGRRFDSAVLVVAKSVDDDGGNIGVWVSDGTMHSHVIGLLAWAHKLALEDHPCIGHGISGGIKPPA